MIEDGSYFNTNHLSGDELLGAEKRASSQEERVLALFVPGLLLDAEQVWKGAMPNSPRHSVSRALSNLKKRGLIEKTRETTMGAYNTPIHLWRLVRP